MFDGFIYRSRRFTEPKNTAFPVPVATPLLRSPFHSFGSIFPGYSLSKSDDTAQILPADAVQPRSQRLPAPLPSAVACLPSPPHPSTLASARIPEPTSQYHTLSLFPPAPNSPSAALCPSPARLDLPNQTFKRRFHIRIRLCTRFKEIDSQPLT